MKARYTGPYPQVKIKGIIFNRDELKDIPDSFPKDVADFVYEDKIKKYTGEELLEMSKTMKFDDFKAWAKKHFRVTGTGFTDIINDIIMVQEGKKKPEL